MYWFRRLLLLLPGRRAARARELHEELQANLSLAIEVYKTACRTGVGRPIEPPQRAAPRLAMNREKDCGV